MNVIKKIACAIAAALLATLLVSGCATQKSVVFQQSMSGDKMNVEKVELVVSNHGKSIVDPQGVEIARAVGDIRFGKDGDKMQGCFRCTDDCVIYDSNGKCIKTVRSCTWDFDCK